MKTFFKLSVLVILLGGWLLASRSLYLVRGPGRFAGIPRTEWAGHFALITKDCMAWRDTYADTSHWTPTELAAHPQLVQRIKESGHKDLISHITETGLADASKSTAAPAQVPIQPQPAPADSKHQKSIFDE